MMLLLGFVLFTGLNGNPIWVKPEHVVTVVPAPDGVCNVPATEIDLDSGKFVCVTETVEAVVSALGRT